MGLPWARAGSRMTHKHHASGNGVPNILPTDLFVLVKNPLAKRPEYFIGHTLRHGTHVAPSKSLAKRMDHFTARAWHEFLSKAGHDFYLAIHHEPEKIPHLRQKERKQ